MYTRLVHHLKINNVLYHTNRQRKKKSHIITPKNAQKGIWQNPTAIHDKYSEQIRKRGELPQLDKKNLQKPGVSIILNDKKLEVFLLRSGTRQGWPFHHSFSVFIQSDNKINK